MNEETKRTLANDSDMEQFFAELVPHLNELEKLIRKYNGCRTVAVTVSGDGYVNASVYNSGFEMTKYAQDEPYKIKKQYLLCDVLDEVV